MALAWLTLIGAAIGIRQRVAFHPHPVAVACRESGQPGYLEPSADHRRRRAGGVVCFGLCKLNWTLTTAALEISLAFLYASALVGGILIVIYGCP